MKTSSSPRCGMKTHPSLRTKQGVRSAFVIEVKTLLSKTEIKLVHFMEAGEDSELKVRVPTERGGTTSKSFAGSVSDIRQDLGHFLDDVEADSKRKQHK